MSGRLLSSVGASARSRAPCYARPPYPSTCWPTGSIPQAAFRQDVPRRSAQISLVACYSSKPSTSVHKTSNRSAEPTRDQPSPPAPTTDLTPSSSAFPPANVAPKDVVPPVYPNAPDYEARKFTAIAQREDPNASSSLARPLPPVHPNAPAFYDSLTQPKNRRPSFNPVIPLRPSPPPRDMPPIPADYTGLWKMYFLAKEYFKFLYGGVKISYAEWKLKNQIRRKIVQDGHQITYQDVVLFRRVKSNNRRMLPFLFLALTIEEFIPLLILFAPQFVPTTGLLPSQATKMQRDLEDKLVRHRSVVLARLKRKTNDDGTPVYPSGWRGDGFQEWKSEEIKEILRVFSWSHYEPTRTYLEGHAHNVLKHLDVDDRYLADRPPAEGFTADEFRLILSARGILSFDLPAEDLPARLDEYLTERRTAPAFNSFGYVLKDILANQEAAEQALAERERLKAVEEEKEKAANGGYSGWMAVMRKALVQNTLPEVKDVPKKVASTDPSLAPVHKISTPKLGPSLSARTTKSSLTTTASIGSSTPPPSTVPSSPSTVAPAPLEQGRKPKAEAHRPSG